MNLQTYLSRGGSSFLKRGGLSLNNIGYSTERKVRGRGFGGKVRGRGLEGKVRGRGFGGTVRGRGFS